LNVHFNIDETEKIVGRFGQAFHDRAISQLAAYAERWGLSGYRLIPSFSANLVLTCHNAERGGAVLKLGDPEAIRNEWQALLAFEGRGFCRTYEADPANGVLLIERVKPGTPLRDEPSLEKRISVFCSLYENLHLPPAQADGYPTYGGWVGRITEYMSKRTDCPELYRHMAKAHEIYLSIAASHSRETLLHGDFHHDNILRKDGGQYVVIDPKGVLGDPVFDIPRFILNEFEEEITPALRPKINEVIRLVEAKLRLPADLIKQTLYVETAMGNCWCVESGATPEEFPALLANVAFAESLMEHRT